MQEIGAMLWDSTCLKTALDQSPNELTVTFCQMVWICLIKVMLGYVSFCKFSRTSQYFIYTLKKREKKSLWREITHCHVWQLSMNVLKTYIWTVTLWWVIQILLSIGEFLHLPWYQVCARHISAGTLLILYISEADQTEIREPASFVGRNKHFQQMTFSISLNFFFVVVFGLFRSFLELAL